MQRFVQSTHIDTVIAAGGSPFYTCCYHSANMCMDPVRKYPSRRLAIRINRTTTRSMKRMATRDEKKLILVAIWNELKEIEAALEVDPWAHK